jgi:hypothetical protein
MRRVQLAMALRWIVAICPRKFLGIANNVSIWSVRSIFSCAGDPNSASSSARPSQRREIQAHTVVSTHCPVDGVKQGFSWRHLADRQTTARKFVLRPSGTRSLTHFPVRQNSQSAFPGRPAIYTRLCRHAMCAAHTFRDEGFPIGHRADEFCCCLYKGVTQFLQFFPRSAVTAHGSPLIAGNVPEA